MPDFIGKRNEDFYDLREPNCSDHFKTIFYLFQTRRSVWQSQFKSKSFGIFLYSIIISGLKISNLNKANPIGNTLTFESWLLSWNIGDIWARVSTEITRFCFFYNAHVTGLTPQNLGSSVISLICEAPVPSFSKHLLM